MAENGDAEAAPAAAPHRTNKGDASVMVEGIFELLRCTLSEAIKPELIERGIEKARKQPAVKAMLAQARLRGSSAAAKAARGPSNMRSAYNAFVQECFHHLKAANIQVGLMEIGGLWNVLPDAQKAEFNKRFGAVKDAYNAKLAATGTAPVLSDVVAAHEAAEGLQPLNYTRLYTKHKDAITAAMAAAAEAKAAGTPTANGKAKPKPHSAAAAAAADATPATESKRPAEPETEEKPKHKKHKKEKGEGDETSEKKHKHKKEKKEKKHREKSE